MKIIVTGATGFIGSTVLRTCLSQPSITSIVVLARGELPPSQRDDKVRVVVVKDFGEAYGEEVRREIRDAEGCVWCQGLANPSNKQLAENLGINYPQRFLDEISTAYDPAAADGRPFRFMMLSGGIVERDQGKKLWFLGEGRKMRGRGETMILSYPTTSPHLLTSVARPAYVTSSALGYALASATLGAIRVEVLARAMVDVVVRGDQGGKGVWESGDLVARAEGLGRG